MVRVGAHDDLVLSLAIAPGMTTQGPTGLIEPFPVIRSAPERADFFSKPKVADTPWNHIAFARGSEENGMETMKIHVLERALTAACIIAAIAVVWWGFKIMAA